MSQKLRYKVSGAFAVIDANWQSSMKQYRRVPFRKLCEDGMLLPFTMIAVSDKLPVHVFRGGLVCWRICALDVTRIQVLLVLFVIAKALLCKLVNRLAQVGRHAPALITGKQSCFVRIHP